MYESPPSHRNKRVLYILDLYADGFVAGNRNLIQDTDVGEIVVYNVKDKDIPIVHRVVRKFGTGYVSRSQESIDGHMMQSF